jgi:hypothetical protein
MPMQPAAATVSASATTGTSLSRKQRWFRAWEDNKRNERKEAREARRYYHDKQWTDEEIKRLTARGQQPTVRNRIKRKIDFLVGVEQRLRRDPKAVARTPQHEQSATAATEGLRYAFDAMQWEQVSSAVMHDGLVSGIGIGMIDIKRGDPVLTHVEVDRFFYDPRSNKPDFSDARYMGLHLWMDVDEAKERWPDHASKIDLIIDTASASMTGTALEEDRATQWGDLENRRVRVIEFWEKKQGGDWYYCYFSGEVEFESGTSPLLDEDGVAECRYIAWSPYIDEKGDRYGLVRTMRSVQDEINYAASKYLHRISADRFFYSEDAIEDVDEFSRQLARPDGKIKLVRGEWGKDIGIIDQRVQIQGEAERYQLAASEIENMGPNPGLVGKGAGVDAASGRALLAQRDSGMTELSPVFESHRSWKLRVYRRVWALCKQVWTGEKWIRITDDPRTPEFIGLNQYQQLPDGTLTVNNAVAEMDVDIILTEGPDTITVNEELMQTLSGLGEAALSPLGKVMIELSNAPNKERLIKMMEQATATPPEVQEMQQRMANLEAALKAIQVDEKVAAVEATRAKTLQTLVQVATPPQQETDQFGIPIGAPPQGPDLMSAIAALQMFPLQYGQPLREQMMTAPAQPEPASMAPGGPEGMPPNMGQMPAPPQDPMAPDMMVEPEQISVDGGLPVDPMA